MALIECPECGNQISDKALICPTCGYSATARFLGGYEYCSKTELFGLPLIHIVLGFSIHPITGKIRVAKGIIAIGNLAVGGVALGGLSLGLISLGGLAIGLLALGGLSIGLLIAIGGFAMGIIAIGGGAFGYYALGGGAFGAHPLGGNAQDPNAIEFFKSIFGSCVEKLNQAPNK